MKIGIGLPNHLPGTSARLIGPWTREAERVGFDSVTTIDRLVYPTVDTIVALALAAGASTRLALITNILLAPLYQPAILAKQLASVADATGGDRLTLGIAVGARRDDYACAGVDFERRGKLLDDEITTLTRAWQTPPESDTATCAAPIRIPLLFGGTSGATIRRATTVGDGWVAGALRDYPTQAEFLQRLHAQWSAVGRAGTPLTHASVNFALGEGRILDEGRDHLARYYGFIPDHARMTIDDLVTTADDARATVRAYRDLGFDHLLFHPTVANPDQVRRLADAVAGRS